MLFCVFTECRDVLLPMMLRELGGALASMADGPHDERRNSLELLNKILEVLSRDNVVRRCTQTHTYTKFVHILLLEHAQTAFWVIVFKANRETKAHFGDLAAQDSCRE